MKNLEENKEEFVELVKELEDKLLIVEGKRDRKALKVLGLKNIIALNGKPLQEIAYKVSKKFPAEIVILTDFDHEGKKLAKKLNFLLRSYRKKVNLRLRRKLMEFGKNRIEDFGSTIYLEENRGDVYVKTCSNFDKICDKGFNKGRWSSGKT